jgi:hypothetical protein
VSARLRSDPEDEDDDDAESQVDFHDDSDNETIRDGRKPAPTIMSREAYNSQIANESVYGNPTASSRGGPVTSAGHSESGQYSLSSRGTKGTLSNRLKEDGWALEEEEEDDDDSLDDDDDDDEEDPDEEEKITYQGRSSMAQQKPRVSSGRQTTVGRNHLDSSRQSTIGSVTKSMQELDVSSTSKSSGRQGHRGSNKKTSDNVVSTSSLAGRTMILRCHY